MDFQHRILPFYMTYPEAGYGSPGQYPKGEMGYRNQGQYPPMEGGFRTPGQYPQGANVSPNPRQQIPAERGYPYPPQYSPSDAMRDLEYLQQLYPYEVRRYQRRVAEILDKMDYEGSMIYDEYPDRVGLERLVNTVWNIIKREEENGESDISQSPETWEWIKALLFVLLNTEVYKRRNGSRRRFPRLL